MIKRKAIATWNGDLQRGRGRIEMPSGAFEGQYSFASRFEQGAGTNPEELIAAAHAGCFSMALSNILAMEGFSPETVSTTAEVSLAPVEDDFAITIIRLDTSARVPGIEPSEFQRCAQKAKNNCPVSKAMSGPEIILQARLEK